RHTRLVSDWSSDVCSSDLGDGLGAIHGAAGLSRSATVGSSLRILLLQGGSASICSSQGGSGHSRSRCGTDGDATTRRTGQYQRCQQNPPVRRNRVEPGAGDVSSPSGQFPAPGDTSDYLDHPLWHLQKQPRVTPGPSPYSFRLSLFLVSMLPQPRG